MSGHLLDVNVLLALAWPNHQFHASARNWLKREGAKGWWTCAITELGFVRLSCNPTFTPNPRTPDEALLLLQALTERKGHRYLGELPPVTETVPSGRLLGHRQTTDTYLLGLAKARKLTLATFDTHLQRLGALILKPQ